MRSLPPRPASAASFTPTALTHCAVASLAALWSHYMFPFFKKITPKKYPNARQNTAPQQSFGTWQKNTPAFSRDSAETRKRGAQTHSNRGQHKGGQKAGWGYLFEIHIGFCKNRVRKKSWGLKKPTLSALFEIRQQTHNAPIITNIRGVCAACHRVLQVRLPSRQQL